MARNLLDSDPQQAQQLSQEALSIATSIGYALGEATARTRLAWFAYLRGEIHEALRQALVAEGIANEHNAPDIACNALYMAAIAHEVVGNYAEAFELRLRILESARTREERDLESMCLCTIGLQYERRERYEQAAEAYEKALSISEALDTGEMALYRNNLAAAYAKHGQTRRGIALAMQALAECSEDNLRTQSYIYHTLGQAYASEGDYGTAVQHYQHALLLHDRTDSQLGEDAKVELLIDLAELHLRHQQTGLAHGLLQQALQLAEQIKSPALQIAAHKGLVKTYKLKRDFATALAHSELAEEIELTDLSSGIEQRLSALQVAHEVQETKYDTELFELKAHKLVQMAREKTQAIEQTQTEMVNRLAATIALRHAEDGFHIERVSQLSAALGQALGLAPDVVQCLRQASRLHDIGNITLSDRLISKTKRYTGRERYLLRLHTLAGANLLRGSPSPVIQMAEEIALTHHEQWDGHGYPHRLLGNDIPISGRIVAVAHAFEQLAFGPQPLAPLEALMEMRAGSGTLYDPVIVQTLAEVLPAVLPQLPHAEYSVSSTLSF